MPQFEKFFCFRVKNAPDRILSGACGEARVSQVLSRLMGSRTSSRRSALPLKGIRG